MSCIDRNVTAPAAGDDLVQHAKKMEAIGHLALGIAHDFNNLLTAITGYTELMISAMSPDDPKIRDAYEVRRAALSAAGLTKRSSRSAVHSGGRRWCSI